MKIAELSISSLYDKKTINSNCNIIKISTISDDVWIFENIEHQNILRKLQENFIKLKTFANPCTGLTTGKDKIYILTRNQIEKFSLELEILLPVVRGRNISRYNLTIDTDFVIYPYKLVDGQTELIEEKELSIKYPNIYSYLCEHRAELGDRKDSRKFLSQTGDWYKLIRKGKFDLFKNTKILSPGISKENRFAIDHSGCTYLCGGAGVFGITQDKFDIYYLLGLLNSKVVQFFLHSISTKKQGGYCSYLNTFLEQIPIPEPENNQITVKAKEIELNSSNLILLKTKFQKYLIDKYNLENISEKLKFWYELSFGDFIKELQKSIKAKNKGFAIGNSLPVLLLNKKEEFEWMEFFEENKTVVQNLQTVIDNIENEIDQMVYELYGLSEEEIKIVEGN